MDSTLTVNQTDRADIEACLAGDENAYGRLVKRYESELAKLMWRFCRDSAVCEELVQEVFVEAYFGLAGFRGEAPFSHWLKRIGSRVGYRFWRNQSREAGRFSLEDYDGVAPEPDNDITPEQAGEILHRLLAHLNDADRLVLTLMYFDECSTRDIAERMGWTRAMVKMRASRARRKLKSIAEQQGLLEAIGWTR